MDERGARIGTMLKDKWRIDALLGVGGMATVYAATHRNGKRVAVKMLHPELSRDPSVRERFVREGYVANRVGKGAVTVDDDDVAEDGAAFLVMELLEGETLEGRRERSPTGRLPAREVATFADQVLDTLASAHALGVVHRDLKPENIFLTSEGIVKILDFGIARLREGDASKSATATGTVMGTPAYLPPEQARGEWKNVDGRTDLWAVGATMFALLAGRCVHEGENINLLLLAAMTQPAPPLRSVAPFVSEELAAIVDRALLRERDARYPDARAMQGALHSILGRLPYADDGPYVGARSSASSWSPPGTSVKTTPHASRGGRTTPVHVIGAAPLPAQATVASMTSRTLSPSAKPKRPVVLVGAVVGLVAAVGLTVGILSSRSATHAAPSAATTEGRETAAAPSVTAPVAVTASAVASAGGAPAVTPAPPTARPVSVTDPPDVSATPSSGASRPAAMATPTAAPLVKPATPGQKPADPFSARR
jgi:serine/threonine-protein kinase